MGDTYPDEEEEEEEPDPAPMLVTDGEAAWAVVEAEAPEPDPAPEPAPAPAVADGAAADEPAPPEPEPEPDPASLPPAAAWHVPVGLASFAPCVVTSGPGCGNSTSVLSCVPQPLPMLALNSSGRELNGVEARFVVSSRFELPPPPMVTLAQFMYISLLPTSLNQVQANSTSLPSGASDGTVKSQVPPVEVGQEPTQL